MLTREQIRESIILDLNKAFENQKESVYWLSKLPMDKESDYDEAVHEFIHDLSQNLDDREYYDILINELVDYYYNNQEFYEFD